MVSPAPGSLTVTPRASRVDMHSAFEDRPTPDSPHIAENQEEEEEYLVYATRPVTHPTHHASEEGLLGGESDPDGRDDWMEGRGRGRGQQHHQQRSGSSGRRQRQQPQQPPPQQQLQTYASLNDAPPPNASYDFASYPQSPNTGYGHAPYLAQPQQYAPQQYQPAGAAQSIHAGYLAHGHGHGQPYPPPAQYQPAYPDTTNAPPPPHSQHGSPTNAFSYHQYGAYATPAPMQPLPPLYTQHPHHYNPYQPQPQHQSPTAGMGRGQDDGGGGQQGGTWWFVPGPQQNPYDPAQGYAYYPPQPQHDYEQQLQQQQQSSPLSQPHSRVPSFSPTHTHQAHLPRPIPSRSSSSSAASAASAASPAPSISSAPRPRSREREREPQRELPPLRDRERERVQRASVSGSDQEREKPLVRRPYHPNPPAHRSEWVMWAGNVPSDAGHDELWRFFTTPQAPASESGSSSGSSGQTAGGGAGTTASGETAGAAVPVAGPSTALASTPAAAPAPVPPSPSTSNAPAGPGVLSIFLISRSNCAFVNYESAAHLSTAIERFNGVSLRPNDPRCPRLVCRVRRGEDDLKAGVGGQRGMGIHARWVKDKKARERAAEGKDKGKGRAAAGGGVGGDGADEADADVSSISGSDTFSTASSEIDAVGVRERPPLRPLGGAGSKSRSAEGTGSSGSGEGSHASTDSSLLRVHFPQRYFILKSLTREDLDLSVSTGLWATQKHNEGVLDRAFRTSKDVYLIFSVNKSGEFYGYARMASPIGPSESAQERVTWARRESSTSSSNAESLSDSPTPALAPEPVLPTDPSILDPALDDVKTPSASSQVHAPILSAERFVGESPEIMTGLRPTNVQSAPAILGQPHRLFSGVEPALKYSLDHHLVSAAARAEPSAAMIQLDESAPFRAMRVRAVPPVDDVVAATAPPALGPVPEEGSGLGTSPIPVPTATTPDWGNDFALTWICTDRLPFTRARNIHNPWNHDREVKMSRDGTELEPGVGKALLDEWRVYLEEGPEGSAASASASGSTSASALFLNEVLTSWA
ncbi:hypothetical protein HMN09_00912600 [Mycena chlorophos]|uniref:YTH domain-containing protein n=1 Tax=Mycena chlorophos TaxID=658473 RepID=A0A8H6SM08_MYCCL|nr:hypothetical protein HMN09_00912600 [Mycena chlorophos]